MATIEAETTTGRTTTRTAVAHLKARAAGGGLALERCEDAGCTVDARGLAGCGRTACPVCGCGGGNLAFAPLGEASCSCGAAWRTAGAGPAADALDAPLARDAAAAGP